MNTSDRGDPEVEEPGACLLECVGPGSFCPKGYTCEAGAEVGGEGALWVCAPEGTSGCCAENTAEAIEACVTANEFGECAGFRRCQGKSGWSTCDSKIPNEETCDKIDNDCDGETDESTAQDALPWFID